MTPSLYLEYSHKYVDPDVWEPCLRHGIARCLAGLHGPARVLDLGCGSGALAAWLARAGWRVEGVDLSQSGIDIASRSFPEVKFHRADVTGDLVGVFGQGAFDVIVSAEVIEHLCNPRQLLRNAYDLLKPGGVLVLTTPYHGYLKNFVLALTGAADRHYTALWDGGHIKFWSRRTLVCLLSETGFELREFHGAGRLPYLWKSMILKATRPGSPQSRRSH